MQSALGQLPATVQQLGITVAKNSGTFVMGIALTSDNKSLDTLAMSNYAQLNIVNDLSRVPGVSQVIIFGQRQYAMRIWLNPDQAGSSRDSTPATSSGAAGTERRGRRGQHRRAARARRINRTPIRSTR